MGAPSRTADARQIRFESCIVLVADKTRELFDRACGLCRPTTKQMLERRQVAKAGLNPGSFQMFVDLGNDRS